MVESRIKNTKKNLIYSVIFQMVKILLIFINRILFANKLGAAYLGINGLFTNVLGLFSLAELGLSTTMMYSLYKPIAEKDEKKISQYLNYFKNMYNYIAIIILVIGIIFIPFLKYVVNLPEDIPHIYLYYILLLINSVISYLFIHKTTLISADQKMYIINKYDTIFQIVLFILQVLILMLTESFALYLFANIVCTFTGNFLKVKKTEKVYPFLKNRCKEKLETGEKKKVFENLKSLFLYKIGSVIQTNTDNILISIFVGTITLGYYSNYSTIILAITSFLTMFFTSLKSSVGNYIVKKDISSQVNMFNILETYNFWLVGFCSICFMILIPDFINICFGQEYVLSFGLLLCAVLGFYTSNIRQVLWIYRETTGLFNKTKHITIVTSAINLVLSIIGGYYWGLVGILGATVISRMLYAWWKEPKILFGEYFKTSSMMYIKTYVTRVIVLVISYLVTILCCIYLPSCNVYLSFILKCLVCIVVPTIIFFVIYRKTEAFKYLKSNILKVK